MSDVAWLDFVADEHLSVYQLLHVTRLARGKVMQTDLCMMAVGLLETRKGLKDTNSVYCHCDLMAKHSLKLLMGSNLAVQSGPGNVIDASCRGFQAGGLSIVTNIGTKLW